MNAGSFAPALVLNADFRPLNYFPLSLWSWQDAVKAVCLDRVTIISEYEDSISSPSFEMKLPSVIALKEYVPQVRNPREVADHAGPQDLLDRQARAPGAASAWD